MAAWKGNRETSLFKKSLLSYCKNHIFSLCLMWINKLYVCCCVMHIQCLWVCEPMSVFIVDKSGCGNILSYHTQHYVIETQFGIEPGAFWHPVSPNDPHVILIPMPLTARGCRHWHTGHRKLFLFFFNVSAENSNLVSWTFTTITFIR